MNAQATYRWNTPLAAGDYDAAATEIHPLYETAQDAVIRSLPFATDQPIRFVDLGGGSGRLVERLLHRYPASRATLVEPSGAFRELARRRLRPFGDRVAYSESRAQEGWNRSDAAFDAIVSTSALHHLDGGDKNAAFRRCSSALVDGGVFINGDEYRPPSDARYRHLLEEWGEHMASQLAVGAIPESFRDVLTKWRERNLTGFGLPRESGDDCHETVEEQTARLYGAGFRRVQTAWSDRLWAVLVATR